LEEYFREWHRSSIGDLRSVSQLASHDRGSLKNGFADVKPQWPSTGGQRKYRSEQNLVSLDALDGEKKSRKIPKAKLRVMLDFSWFCDLV
jgi:hypothetical protein